MKDIFDRQESKNLLIKHPKGQCYLAMPSRQSHPLELRARKGKIML